MSQYTTLTTADGDLDPQFGLEGRVSVLIPSAKSTIAQCIVEGPDDNLYVTASIEPSNNIREFTPAVVCLHKNGAINEAFGNKGIVIQRFTPQLGVRMQQIHFLEDGTETKILLCAVDNTNDINVLIRLHINGRLDETFGEKGLLKVILPAPLSDSPEQMPTSQASSDIGTSGISTVANGKIYLAKHVYMAGLIADIGIITRLNADGSLDLSFNKTGYVAVAHGYWANTTINDIFVQNGKITVCGSLYKRDTSQDYGMLARLNDDGTFDQTFAENGFALVPEATFHRLTQYAEDSILAAGSTLSPAQGVLACFTKEGQLDPKFNGGKILYQSDTERGAIGFHDVGIVQEKIIVAGKLIPNAGLHSLMVARYQNDGTLDPGFGNGKGLVYVPQDTSFGFSTKMALQKDGNVLLIRDTVAIQDRTLIARVLNTNQE
ncbi:hypothetical protein [Pseudomonas neuropathica]|jgi:uncharacterized delta-60 repeat protein|uniref:Uncharacterized protein n=1 Tax=Pseudomonas neuropathica TaxID=2730425 RepID=A0ACC7MXI7_9PSED